MHADLIDGSPVVRAWRGGKIIWAVLTNIFVVAITFLLFSHASTDFERLILCLIILIYQSVNWSHTTQMRVAIEEAFVVRTLVLNLLKRAGEETESAEEEIAEASKKYQRQNTLYYINLGGASVVYIVVIWEASLHDFQLTAAPTKSKALITHVRKSRRGAPAFEGRVAHV